MISILFYVAVFGALTMMNFVEIAANLFFTGQLFRLVRVEKLDHPAKVSGWDSEGLLLADGRHVPLPEIDSIPADSVILTEAVRRGVEVGADGRVVGLIKIHHWCGNDPVGKEIARVDLARVLQYFETGGVFCRAEPKRRRCENYSGAVSQYGWWLNEYRDFRDWEKSLLLKSQ